MHVDIVKNEWLAGFQLVAARVSFEEGELTFESGDDSVWRPVVLHPLPDQDSDDLVYPEKEPEHFMELLPTRIQGSYLWATQPHEQKECQFDHFVVAMQPTRGRGQAEVSR